MSKPMVPKWGYGWKTIDSVVHGETLVIDMQLDS